MDVNGLKWNDTYVFVIDYHFLILFSSVPTDCSSQQSLCYSIYNDNQLFHNINMKTHMAGKLNLNLISILDLAKYGNVFAVQIIFEWHCWTAGELTSSFNTRNDASYDKLATAGEGHSLMVDD